MTSSFAYSKGKKYYYYRCTADNDNSKKTCRISSVSAPQLEGLVVHELKFLAKDPLIIESVVDSATKERKKKVKDLALKKKVLQGKLAQIDKEVNNFLEILGREGKKSSKMTFILKKLDELEKTSKQIKNEIDYLEFEQNNIENKIVNADVIRQTSKSSKTFTMSSHRMKNSIYCIC